MSSSVRTSDPKSPPGTTRRAVLGGLTALGGQTVLGGLTTLGLGACTGATDLPEQQPSAAPTAIVIGAGLAGLCAAYDLDRMGWDVTVVEASTQVGGRIRTVRQPALPDGLHMEAGGELIQSDHQHILRLAEELRVELVSPQRRAGLQDVTCLDLLPLPDAQVLTSQIVAELTTVRETLALYTDPGVTDLPLEAALRPLGPSRTVVQLIDAQVRTRTGFGLESLSAAFVATMLASTDDLTRASRVAGGADRMIRALVRAIGGTVRTSTPVTAVSQTARGVTVTTNTGDLQADRAVLAVPANLAATLDLGLPEVSDVLGLVRVSQETQVLMVYDAPSWFDARFTGTLHSDGPVGLTYDASVPDSTAMQGLLIARSVGSRAGALLALSQAVGEVKNAIDQCMPTDPFTPGRPALTVDWTAQPWALGGRPGYDPQAWAARSVFAQPLGRLHLAGDYNGSRPGTMDAAVESGRRAARQIAG